LEIVKNVSVSRLGSIDPVDAFVLVVDSAGSSVIKAAEKLQSGAVAAKTFDKGLISDVRLVSL
jgi:hypothetical protein